MLTDDAWIKLLFVQMCTVQAPEHFGLTWQKVTVTTVLLALEHLLHHYSTITPPLDRPPPTSIWTEESRSTKPARPNRLDHAALLDDRKLVSCFSDHKDSATPVWAPGRQSHTHRSPKQTLLPAANIRGTWEQGCSDPIFSSATDS